MNNSIANWLRLRTFLLRLALSSGLMFLLTDVCGQLTTHVIAWAGQPQEKEEVKPKPKPEAPPGTDPAEFEKNKKILEEGFGLKPESKAPGDVKKLSIIVPPRKPGKVTLEPLPPTLISGSQIQIPPGLRGLDLRAVDRINDRFLLDIPELDRRHTSYFRPLPIVRASLKERFADTSVITAAKLADGTEVLTVIDMPGSFDSGSLAGRVEVLLKDTDNTNRVRKIVGERGQGARVFFYGDDLRSIDLTSIAKGTGVELIRRTNKTRNLFSVQERLNTIASRAFDPERTVIVNGLPASREAVENMGPFAGPAERWLDFRESIDSSTPPSVETTSVKDDFVRHLEQGDSDLLVVVAHSDGFYFYLNGSRMSLEEIGALPDRQKRSERPRLALIASCNAGKTNSPSMWRRILRRDYAPLAHLLLEKGFVDKVIAPDHDIGPAEALEAFRKALAGHTQSILHWNEWAVRVRPLFGVPS